ncbi:hypothetical protein [Alkaliphilus sp. B6464]|uniref:hypothetical protein n=1 Tax=Alkaliphilus sp. B6464 TaxID=2731219 RepID=UPI001BA868F3|nr:hypothetical protein [Alkaliphilus sp. B6464]QUH22176.1 hypothetical protein HYG84_19910 [Alkaliphilus sp. B6464]
MNRINIGEHQIDIETLNNKNLKIIFSSFTDEINTHVKVRLNNQDIQELIETLEPFNTKDVKKEGKAYCEDMSTFKDGVERTLTLSGRKGDLSLRLDAYTPEEYDDNWIVLTPSKLSKLIGLLYGYLY